MSDLQQLEPTFVWKHFLSICAIPHPSRHEARICNFIIDFAKAHGLQWQQDEIGNIVVKKPASPGCEHIPGIILQSHLDMVAEKNSDVEHDFINDPIQPWIDGEWLKAQGTTLGADNGIGVAAILAVLESEELTHGPLEALFTVIEECGMVGARELAPNMLDGTLMLNLDTEQEGELFIGCAGGIRVYAKDQYTPEAMPEGSVLRKISITGLLGGHSGTDAHRNRGTAIQLVARVLKALAPCGARLSSFLGGSVVNAISREAVAVITIPEHTVADCEHLLARQNEIFTSELPLETGLKLTMEEIDSEVMVMPRELQDKWITALANCPQGAQKMSEVIEGVVETSNNLGVVKITDGTISVENLPRSLVDNDCEALAYNLKTLFRETGAESWDENGYPGWQPNLDSMALTRVKDTYETLYGKEPVLKVVHAGLECGLLGKAYPDWDMISFGPTIKFAHSPDEKVHIGSVSRFWELLTASIEAIARQ